MRLIIVLFILLVNHIYGGVIIKEDSLHSKFSGRVFVISIGVDKYADSKFNLLFCQSDADYFLKSLERDTTIKEILKYIVRNDGTKEQLKLAFSEVTKNANKQDLFIFYYAGMSSGNSFKLTNEEFDYEEVFALSQNIFAERQIYISDANDGQQFGIAFKQFLKQKPLEKISTKIDEAIQKTCDFKPQVLNVLEKMSAPFLMSEQYQTWFKLIPLEVNVTDALLSDSKIKMNLDVASDC
jgi:hypothetical protein